jgi:hypothetical protein
VTSSRTTWVRGGGAFDLVREPTWKPAHVRRGGCAGFTREGVLKLLDFGLIKAIPKNRETDQAPFHMTGGAGSLRYSKPALGHVHNIVQRLGGDGG